MTHPSRGTICSTTSSYAIISPASPFLGKGCLSDAASPAQEPFDGNAAKFRLGVEAT
jgi:hypothetical protein